MRTLQPIYWTNNGKTYKGIVTEVLPGELSGVIARSVECPDEPVKVHAPHKIRDLKEMTEIWNAMGVTKEMAEKAGYIKPKKAITITEAPIHTEADYNAVFEKALAEIEAACDIQNEAGLKDRMYLKLWQIGAEHQNPGEQATV